MEDKGPIIGYWQIRGLGELAKLIMEFGKKPYQMQYYKQGPGPEWSRKSWMDKKFMLGLDFPDLPYVIDGDIRITQSMNIYNYLMIKYVPELSGKTQAEKVKVQESFFALRDLKNGITSPCYNPDKSKVTEAIANAAPKIGLVQKKLGDDDWLVGDSPTICDLMLMEITDQLQMMTQGAWLKDHPALEAHNTRVKSIPSIKEYKSSARSFEGPFNNPIATTNNVPADYWN